MRRFIDWCFSTSVIVVDVPSLSLHQDGWKRRKMADTGILGAANWLIIAWVRFTEPLARRYYGCK